MEKGSPAAFLDNSALGRRRLRTPIAYIKRSADAGLAGYAPGETLQFARSAAPMRLGQRRALTASFWRAMGIMFPAAF
jgi:hypothetical protein